MLYKNSPGTEAKKRLNMSYLLLTNKKVIEIIEKRNSYFFHGTNANTLPSILKYGIYSVNTSEKNNIEVSTGESRTRIDDKRSFVSLTDCLEESLKYANLTPKSSNSKNKLLNFGVIIGTSFEDMNGLKVLEIESDISEIGVKEQLPLDRIKFLAVPDDKVEFVKKMVGKKDIDVISMDFRDEFFKSTFEEKLQILEESKEKIESPHSPNPTYFKNDVRKLVNNRRTSKINGIIKILKEKINTKQTEYKNIGGRE